MACLNGGLNNFIATPKDDYSGNYIDWGGFTKFPPNKKVGSVARSSSDGAPDTAAIVDVLGSNGVNDYAALVCSQIEYDSKDHSPCQHGNICYDDWFLPAGPDSQLNCLWSNLDLVGGFVTPRSYYWSSTEASKPSAWAQYFAGNANGWQGPLVKNYGAMRVRCIRAFTPN